VQFGRVAHGLTTPACKTVQSEVLNIDRVMHPS
jgi:hypothetical protein